MRINGIIKGVTFSQSIKLTSLAIYLEEGRNQNQNRWSFAVWLEPAMRRKNESIPVENEKNIGVGIIYMALIRLIAEYDQ